MDPGSGSSSGSETGSRQPDPGQVNPTWRFDAQGVAIRRCRCCRWCIWRRLVGTGAMFVVIGVVVGAVVMLSSACVGGRGRAGCRCCSPPRSRRCSAGGPRCVTTRARSRRSAPGHLAAPGRPASRRRPGGAGAGPRRSDDADPTLVRLAQTSGRPLGHVRGRRDRVLAEGRAGPGADRGLASGHGTAPRRDRIRQDDLQVLSRWPRSSADRASSLSIRRGTTSCPINPRGRGQGRAAPAVGSAGQNVYNPLRTGDQTPRSRTSCSRRRCSPSRTTSDSLSATSATLFGRCGLAGVPSQSGDRGRAHAPWTASIPDSQMAPTDARPLLDIPRDADSAAGADLAGARDRLAILAESDVGPYSIRQRAEYVIDLRDSLDRGDVVLFGSRPIDDRWRRRCSARRSSRISSRSATSVSTASSSPGSSSSTSTPRVGAPQTRAPLRPRPRRAAQPTGPGTQEAGRSRIADTNVAGGGGGILAQIAGNLEVLLCGRQNMPASAELVAAIAGTRGAWITTQQTHAPAAGLLTGLGSRSRGREYVIHPDTIKSLDVGEFVVIEPRLRAGRDRPRLPSRRAATPWCRMLTERDITITEWIGRQGAVRAEHVMTRFSIGPDRDVPAAARARRCSDSSDATDCFTTTAAC